MVDQQPLDVSTLLAGGALVVLLAVLGWYAYARGTRHGDDGSDPPAP